MDAANAGDGAAASTGAAAVDVRDQPAKPLGDVEAVRETQTAVSRLLRYAVSQANIRIDDEYIDLIVPILQQPAAKLALGDVAKLWKGYNKLALLVYPATSESILVAEQIEEARRRPRRAKDPDGRLRVATVCRRQLLGVIVLLCTILLVFLGSQAYGIYLGDILHDAERHNVALESVSTQIRAMKEAKSDLTDETPPLKDLVDQRDSLDKRIIATYSTLVQASRPWRGLYTLSEATASAADTAVGRQYRRIALEQGARSVLRVWNFYVLPLVLGLLGAVAFITRRLLASLANNSYTPNTVSRYMMRLALGALLGVVGGIILAPDQPSLQGFSLSLVTLAFLMGYSVEFAFSAFDTLIERGRRAFQADSVIAAKG
ncbi:MAG: hypothetical protein HY899_02545 [Deltaproteobacteria bacterium]|nr:hypothetical protein [Deltaproteobacteria bacterium]